MAVIGWLAVTAVLTVFSFGWLVAAWLNSRKYTIGGQPISVLTRLSTLVAGVVLALGWWFLVVQQSPFAIALK